MLRKDDAAGDGLSHCQSVDRADERELALQIGTGLKEHF